MEEIINKIIDIDNNSKRIVEQELKKKNNIDDYIESEFNNEKIIIDIQYKKEIIKVQEKYKNMFEEKKNQIKDSINEEIKNIEKKYSEVEDKLVNDIVAKVIKEEG